MGLDHLAVYLSNSCNLSCSYCYVAVNQGPAASLDADQISRSIDEFCLKISPRIPKITFIGGEPLLNWPLFVKVVTDARARAGNEAILQTFTNGTLLTPEKIAFMEQTGVHCTISLDGRKEDNDLNRVYWNGAGRSVFDDVMAKISSLRKMSLGVSLVFTSKTVDRLLSNINAFHQMGFGRITFNPELYEIWPDEKIEIMKTALKGITRWYKALLVSGVTPPQLQILYAVLESLENNRLGKRWWHDCHNMTLGPDGKYYSCDKALSFPIGQAAALRTGAPGQGMDWDERKRQIDGFVHWIEKLGDGDKEIFCPIGVVAHARQAGRSPEEALGNFRRVATVFAEGLSNLVDQCEGYPAFKDLYVRAHIV